HREQGRCRARGQQGTEAPVRFRYAIEDQAPTGRARRRLATGGGGDPRRRPVARIGSRAQEDLTAMATKSKTANVDLNSVFEGAASQFRGLNPSEPGQWPLLPKALTFVAVAFAMVVVGWFLVLSSVHDELDAERNKEPTLKADYRNKLAQAVNLS